MLYLIRSFSRISRKSSLKVGFTDDIGKRMSDYLHMNPFFEHISSRRGSLREEKLLHLYLTALGYKEDFLDEWFIDCPDVLSLFHSCISDMERVIWKNRGRLFKVQDFRVRERYGKVENIPLLRQIYEDLRSRYMKVSEEIDKEYDRLVSVSALKSLKKELKTLYML